MAAWMNAARLRQVGGWVVLGVAAAGVEFALLRLLTVGLGVPLWLASALAAETLILVRFVIADRWVFGHPAPTFSRLWRYHGACVGALAAYWVVINAVVALWAAPDWLAFLLGTGASFGWSLVTNFLWVWRPAAPAPVPAPSLAVGSKDLV